MKALLPDHETARLEALGEYNILDTAPEEAFDDITALAAQICETPIALITLVEPHRQWFKSKFGLTVTQTPREIAFCTYAIQQKDVFVVQDAWVDERFTNNPLVTAEPHIRFYAGAPLITSGGYALGTLCVIDFVPREPSSKQLGALQALSRQVMAQLELRKALTELAEATQQSKQLKKKLRHRELELLDFLENGTSGLHCVDANGIILWANQTELDLLGYTREEYMGCHIADFHADKAVIDDILQRLTRNETLKNYEAKLRCKDGSSRYVLINSNVAWEDGKFSHTRCFTRDITEYKQAEQQCGTLRATLQRFFNLSLDLLCIAGLDGYFKRLNPAWEKTLGHSHQELQSKPFLEFVHPEDRAATIAEVEKLATGTPTIDFENRYRCEDGSYKWLAWTAFPNIEDSLFYCVARDISQLKEAQQERLQLLKREQAARAESEAARNQMTQILESITDAFLALDYEWRFTYLNQQAEQLLQRKREELLGQCVWDEFPEAVSLLFYQEYHRALTEQVSVEFEAFYPPLNTWFSVHAYPGEQGLSVYFEDINERKRAEAVLIETTTLQRAILDSANYAIISTTPDATIGTFNAAAERLLGYTSEEVVGKVTPLVIHDRTEVVQRARELTEELGIFIEPGFECFVAKARLGTPDEREWTYIRKDGTRFPVLLSVTALRDLDGNITGFLGIGSDITERKRGEEALRQSEERFQLIVKATNDAVWDWDLVTDVVWWSEGVKTLFGYCADEVETNVAWWYSHIHPEERERVVTGIHAAIASSKSSWSDEYRFRRSDKSYAYVFDIGYIIRDSSGKPMRMMGGMTDISERKQAEEELQRQHRRSKLFAEITLKIRQSLQLEEILQTTVTEVQKILQVDRVLLYRVWPNGTGRTVTEAVQPGWPAILGMPFDEEVFPLEYQELYRQGKVRAIADVEQAYAELTPCLLEFLQPWGVKAKLIVPILVTGDWGLGTRPEDTGTGRLGDVKTPRPGDVGNCSINLSPSPPLPLSPSPRLWGLLIAHHCASPRQWTSFETELLQQLSEQIGLALAQAELLERETDQRQELARSNAQLQEFAYVASHDLQEPLRKIQAFGDLLMVKYSEALTNQGCDYLKRMQNAAERMQVLIDDLLTLSRVTTRAQPFVSTNLTQVVQEVLWDLEVRIQQTGGRIEVGELPTLEADPIQMRQLMQNLIGNALKFYCSQEPPVIKIYCRQLFDQQWRPTNGINRAVACQIFVEDNGIGFDEKYLDRIFNPFQRLHGRSEYEGTGMGLAICRKIVERHDGSITAQSIIGKGASFIITLPLRQSQGKAEGCLV